MNTYNEWPDVIGDDAPTGPRYRMPQLVGIRAETEFDPYDGIRLGDVLVYNPHFTADKHIRGRKCLISVRASRRLCIRTINPKDAETLFIRDEYSRRGWAVERDAIEILGVFWGVERRSE